MPAPGERFGPGIESAIRRECDFVLVFIEECALASDGVKREAALALQRQRALRRAYLLPVLLQDVGARMKDLGIDPEEMLYLDATDGSDEGVAVSARTALEGMSAATTELIADLECEHEP